jgi:hypothetical protein
VARAAGLDSVVLGPTPTFALRLLLEEGLRVFGHTALVVVYYYQPLDRNASIGNLSMFCPLTCVE